MRSQVAFAVTEVGVVTLYHVFLLTGNSVHACQLSSIRESSLAPQAPGGRSLGDNANQKKNLAMATHHTHTHQIVCVDLYLQLLLSLKLARYSGI